MAEMPTRDAALAHLHALIDARTQLDHTAEAEAQHSPVRAAPARVDLPTRAATARDRLIRLERAGRRASDLPSIPRALPIRPALVDAQTAADRALLDAAWLTTSTLKCRPLLAYGPAWQVLAGAPWRAAAMQLQIAIPALVCACPHPRARDHQPHPGCWWHQPDCGTVVCVEVGGILAAADEQARAALGTGPAWTPIPGQPCPQCGRRTMQAETSADDERSWTVRCANGCITPTPAEGYARRHGGTLLAVLASIRRHHRRHERTAA